MAERRLGQASLPAMYIPPFSHSAVDDIKNIIVLHNMWTGVFVIWFGVLFGSLTNMN